MEKYIKVTRPDGSYAVINASNRDYYLSIGAKVEKPTEAEIREFHGAAAIEPEAAPASSEDVQRLEAELAIKDQTICDMEAQKATLNGQIAERDAKIADLEKQIADLNAELEAAKAAKKTTRSTTKKE